MDYSALRKELDKASLFELWRLNAMIWRALDDPARLNAIKGKIRIGMKVSYFEKEENRELSAEILDIKRTRVLVRNLHDGRRWNLPFYMLNLEGVDTAVASRSDPNLVDRASLRVGDKVGYFDRQGQERYGEVLRLNPKTAKVRLTTGEVWRVSYSLLFHVLDGEVTGDGHALLEGQVVREDDEGN